VRNYLSFFTWIECKFSQIYIIEIEGENYIFGTKLPSLKTLWTDISNVKTKKDQSETLQNL
jgi:hypothetical protein